MKFHYKFALLLCCISNAAFSGQSSTQQIDSDTWEIISHAVQDADISSMASTYHPDAVVVSEGNTTPISVALKKWGEGMEQARLDGATANVSFRFKSRNDNNSTAHETGIFKYIATDSAGMETVLYMNFETLLVKKENRWLFLMERQLEQTDEASWEALKN